MITTYDQYLAEKKSISVETMQELHQRIVSDIQGDADALELYDDLIRAATRYSSFRAEWTLWDREKKMEEDPSRTSAHNSVIIHFDMLSRYLKSQGKDTNWREILGYEEEDKNNRKRIGDFACYIVFINSLNSR